jgi:hypothetical protein
MNRKSKRFTPTRWMDRLVPALLILIGLAMLAALLLVIGSFF